MRVHDTLLGLFFAALAVAILILTADFPSFPGQKYGPSLFPRILGVGILVCAVVIAWRGWRESRRTGGRRIVAVDAAFADPGKLASFLLVPAGVGFYLLAADPLGFIPTAFALLAGLFLWFRVRPLPALVIAALTTGLMQWFFGTLMRVPLPRGLFMQLIHGG